MGDEIRSREDFSRTNNQFNSFQFAALLCSLESCDAAGLPQDLKNLEIQPLFLMFLHHLAFATSTIQAPSQESFPEDGGAVAFNGITPMFLALRWKRFSR